MVKISTEARAIVALEEELMSLQSEASTLNTLIANVHAEYLKQIIKLSSKHKAILEKSIHCEEAIHETKKLLCKSGYSY